MISLESLWTVLEGRSDRPLHQRVDSTHPLDFYAGIDGDSARVLALIADAAPPEASRRFKCFEVVGSLRGDGRYVLAIRLQQQEFRRLFAHLCDDLVEATRSGCSTADGMRFVSDRIARWERLLSRDRGGVLDERTLRGLVAELVFIRDTGIPHKGPSETIHAWRGPLGADHDFQFSNAALEIKSVTDTLIATVSSIEQLDSTGEPLFLAAIRLESTVEDAASSFSVSHLVEAVKSALLKEPGAAAEFEEKLALSGYRPLPEYDSRRFIVKDIRYFEVSPGFPRLTRATVPPEVPTLTYEIDLRRCEQYRRSSVMEFL